MKTLPPKTSISEHIEGVRLYLEDLDELQGLLLANNLTISITDDTFEYNSFKEVEEKNGRSPRKLSIEATEKDSFDSISLNFNNGRWYIHSHGKEYLSVAREVESLLRKRQTKIAHFSLFWTLQIGLLLLWIASLMYSNLPAISIPLASIGIGLLLAFICLGLYWYLFPKIILQYKHNANFIKRNRDQILLLLFGALFGAAIQCGVLGSG